MQSLYILDLLKHHLWKYILSSVHLLAIVELYINKGIWQLDSDQE